MIRWAKSKDAPAAAAEIFSIPNTAKRSIRLASYLRAEGMRAGAADLLLLVPCGGFHGLALEMKAEGGKVSDHQSDFLRMVSGRGYRAAVAWCAEDAIRIIEHYLKE